MFTKKAISSVIAISLLLIMAVITVISYSAWFENYSTSTYTDIEQKSSDNSFNTKIEAVIGNELFFKNSLSENLTIKSLKIGEENCNESWNISPGLNTIDITNCTSNLSSNIKDIVIITNKGVYTKTINYKQKLAPHIDCSLNGTIIKHNQESIFHNYYLSPEIPCLNETRICNNGIFLGNSSYKYSSCSVGDPYSSNITLAMHFNGSHNSATFTELMGHPVVKHGSAIISTTESKFGGSSLYNGASTSGNSITVGVPSDDLLIFPGDFTVELWYYQTANTEYSFSSLISRVDTSSRSTATESSFEMGILYTGGIYTPTLNVFNDGVSQKVLLANHGTSLNTWNHVAVTREANVLNIFVNGILSNSRSDATGPQTQTVGTRTCIGASIQNDAGYRHSLIGYVDDIRVTNGLARYTTNFTIPSSEFINP